MGGQFANDKGAGGLGEEGRTCSSITYGEPPQHSQVWLDLSHGDSPSPSLHEVRGEPLRSLKQSPREAHADLRRKRTGDLQGTRILEGRAFTARFTAYNGRVPDIKRTLEIDWPTQQRSGEDQGEQEPSSFRGGSDWMQQDASKAR